MNEQLGEAVHKITDFQVTAAIGRLADRAYFGNPATIEAQGYFLDDIRWRMPALWSGDDILGELLRREQRGYTPQQIGMVKTGYDMALMIINELITQVE